MRAFPGWYEDNSIYALFPLTIPSENKKILTNLGKVSLYSFKRPSAPARPCVLSTAKSARRILTDPQAYRLVWDKAIGDLTGKPLKAESRVNAAADDKLLKQVFYDDVQKGLEEIRNFYIKRTTQLLREGSCRFKDYSQVDIIREYLLIYRR
jgi:linoleate 10R-lipoxygenase